MSDRVTDALKKVRQIEIRTNRQVSEALAGAYHSMFKGRGMDFEEAREYQAGDEIRSIDWNVTARTGKAHVKKYREERELTMMLIVDLSASGQFGSLVQSKRELAAELASTLAFSASRNSDKVGLMIFTDKVEKIIPPRKGRQHILRLIRDILLFEPDGKKTNISGALDEVNRLLKRKAIVVLLSDFLLNSKDELVSKELFKNLDITNRRHDLICLKLSDRREMNIPALGLITLEDSETSQVIQINTSSKEFRKNYQRLNLERQKELRRNMARLNIDLLELQTDIEYITPLRKFFQNRKRR